MRPTLVRARTAPASSAPSCGHPFPPLQLGDAVRAVVRARTFLSLVAFVALYHIADTSLRLLTGEEAA